MSEQHLAEGSPFPPKKPDVLRIYSMIFCPFAERTRLVLAHKNISHETVNVNLKSKPSWFLERNPWGQVPTLEFNDKIIYESSVTCDWLDDVYPQNRLTPSDPYKKAQDRMVFEQFSKTTGPLYAIGRAQTVEEKKELLQQFLERIKYFEAVLVARGEGPFFGGENPSMLDFLLWPHFERATVLSEIQDLPDLNLENGKFPKIAAWYKVMYNVPAVKATLIDKEAHKHFFKTFVAGTPDYDYFVKK